MDRERALEIFAKGSKVEIGDTLLAISLDELEHWQWVQEQCLHFLQHSDSGVRGLAATCLGHLARIHRELDREKVVIALRAHLRDEKISRQVEEALNDIHQFLSVFKGYQDFKKSYCCALSTFEEFLDDYEHPLEDEVLKKIEENEKRFPYTTTVKWDWDTREMEVVWCAQVFGPREGECDEPRCCPLSKKRLKVHSHRGLWTSIWLGKTDYDFGYEMFFLKNKATRDVFEREIRR